MEINIPSGGGSFRPFRLGQIVVLVILLSLLSSLGTIFYTVDPDEVGVIRRLGKYVRTTSPGLHLKWPLGIERLTKVKVTHIFKEEFGFRTLEAGVRTIYMGRERDVGRAVSSYRESPYQGDPLLSESSMLSGDLNIAVVEWTVQYRVKDPVAFAFRIRDMRETIRDVSESVMREVVGDRTVTEVLTSGREEIRAEAKRRLQEVLDQYGTGVDVENVVLKSATPPDEVKPSFNEVNEARQEMEKMINQARAEYNRVVPKAKGEAEMVVREAEGYALDRVNRAQGDKDRFLEVWKAYSEAKDVTRRRLYLEKMKELLPKVSDIYVVDKKVTGVLPLLNLTPHETRLGQERTAGEEVRS